MVKIKFKKLTSTAKLPVKGSLHAACYDVYADRVEIEYPGRVIYYLGFSTEIPEGYRGVIVPRSNLTKYNYMMGNSIGIIDSDYRGEWMIKLTSLESPYESLPYKTGDRIAQIYFEKVLDVVFEEVEDLSITERNTGGFGSTGLN